MSSTTLRDGSGVPFVCITVDGTATTVPADVPLAASLWAVGIRWLRLSPRLNGPRGAFCFMGTCQECIVLVDGARAQACQTRVRAGMVVTLVSRAPA